MKRQNIILNSILVIATILVFCNNVVFTETPEIFPKAYEIGNIFSNLSLAYISSYIFYLVVVKYQENKDKKNIYSTIYLRVKKLVDNGNSVVTLLKNYNPSKEKDLLQKITKEDFLKLCKNSDPKEEWKRISFGLIPNNDLFKTTYGQMMYDFSIRYCKDEIDKIFIFMPFLETELLKLLNQVQESNHFKNFSSYSSYDDRGEDMFEYHLLMRKIEKYINKNYKKYLE